MVYIRGIREICGHLNIIHTRICFFSNTNRTNLTNCLGYDPVCIRGIREICGQLNIIHMRICFFSNTNRTNLTNLLGATRYVFVGFGRLLPFGQWVFDKSRGQLNIIHTLIFFFEH